MIEFPTGISKDANGQSNVRDFDLRFGPCWVKIGTKPVRARAKLQLFSFAFQIHHAFLIGRRTKKFPRKSIKILCRARRRKESIGNAEKAMVCISTKC